MKIEYLSTYFCSKFDYNKKILLNKDDFSYIENYYNSIKKNNINCTIFVDAVSDSFIEKYKTDIIKFKQIKCKNIKCKNINKKITHLHDERFFYYLEYIVGCVDTEWFVLTDIADVIILNHIPTIIYPNKNMLYVGKEGENILDNKWFRTTYFNHNIINMIPDYREIFVNKIIYNCGVIFGNRILLLELLSKMCQLFIEFYYVQQIDRPLDMLILNYIIHKDYDNKVYKGNMLTTDFAQNSYDVTKCIKHK